MQNLAGHERSTEICTRELIRCGIEVVPEDEPLGEPQAKVSGRLGKFRFKRAWYYWCVQGAVPLTVAEELYSHPVGKEDIRVAGHCGCPPPANWVEYLTEEGREVLDRKQEAEYSDFVTRHPEMQADMDKYVFADDPVTVGKPFVTSYHIDSEIGLYIFVQALKRHGLV